MRTSFDPAILKEVGPVPILMDGTIYDEAYYVDSQISNYTDYRQKVFTGLAHDIVQCCCIAPDKGVLDFGAATGGLVHALLMDGIDGVQGTDISDWAVRYGVEHYGLAGILHPYNPALLAEDNDMVIMLDVLEHIPTDGIDHILQITKANKVLVRIPVSAIEGEDFVLEVSKKDRTHISVHDKAWWCDRFAAVGYAQFKPIVADHIYDSEGVMAGLFVRLPYSED